MPTLAFTFPPCPPAFQEQPSSTKNVLRHIRSFLDQELKIDIKNTHFLLAVSGGADSLALLCLWHWLRPVYNLSFSVLYVDHALRPESRAEALTLQQLCQMWHISYFTERVDIKQKAQEQKMGIEEMARKTRYALYEKYREESAAQWICLGHHLGDVQEDILMRLLRGAGWPALGGMVAQDARRRILRPLLLLEPEKLRQVLQGAHLTWAEDASNTDTSYLRNRIRHGILPLFQEENPAFAQKMAELWHFAQYDSEHWQHTVHDLYKKHAITCRDASVYLPAKLLENQDKATRLRLYMHALHLLKDAHAYAGQARASTLEGVDQALQEGRGNTSFQLPGGIVALVKKRAVTFTLMTK